MIANLIKVARLPFLIAGLALFLLGALVGANAGGRLSFGALLLGYLTVAAARLSVHFSNDYFDAETDVRGTGSLISGGGGVLQDHPQLREPVRHIAIALVWLSLAAGIALVILYTLPNWILGLILLGNLLGWFYSAPPLRFSARGVGELCYVFAAGLVEPAVGYLAVRRAPDQSGLFMLVPLLSYALVSILNAEIPDLEADRAGRKRNWIVRRGRGFGFTISGLLLAGSSVYFFYLPVLFPGLPVDGRVLGLLSLVPLAPGLAGLILRPTQRGPATRIAISSIIALVVFGVLTDAYLFTLTRR